MSAHDWIDFIVNKILFTFALTLFVLQIWVLLVHGGIPNIRTAPAIRKKIISFLAADFAARGLVSPVIVDLGSGNGLFTRELARAFPYAKIIGLEMAVTSVAWANIYKKFSGLQNLDYRKMNFFDFDFAEADAVVMYLMPQLMTRLGEKFHREVKPGTILTSNKFALGDNWQPVERAQVDTLYKHQGELFIYRA